MLPSSGPMNMTLIGNEAGKPLAGLNVDMVDLRKIARLRTPQSIIRWSDFYGKYRYQFINGNFDQGTLNTSTTPASILGWKIFLQRVRLNGLDNIEGWPTPTDSTKPGPAPGDNNNFTGSYLAALTTDVPSGAPAGTRSMRLYHNNGSSVAFAIIHGPYLVCDVNNSVPLEAGDLIKFYWKAQGGGDAYDIYAYLLNTDNGTAIELANDTGSSAGATTPWIQVTRTITAAQTGTYKFVFVSGTYDFTGGTVLGASLYVTNVDVTKWFDL
jgi:hypothetical protein